MFRVFRAFRVFGAEGLPAGKDHFGLSALSHPQVHAGTGRG